MSVGALLVRRGDVPTPAKTEPERDYLAGGQTYGMWAFDSLASHARRMAALYGDVLYDEMLNDSTVSAGVNTLKTSILADGVQFAPPVTYEDVEEEDATEAEADLAYEIKESWDRAVAGLETPLEDFLWQLLDAIPKGCMLGEITYRMETEGRDAGRLMPLHLRPIARDTWAFEIDKAGNVVGFSGSEVDPQRAGPRVLPRDKFVLLSWLPRDGNPRGTPALDPIYDNWNAKQLLKPEFWAYLNQFASPSLFGTTAEDAGDVEETDDDGNLTGDTINAQEAMYRGLLRFKNGSVFVGPFGSTLTALNPAGDGSAFREAFEWHDRQIALGLLHSPRTMLEAQNSSKADSETAQDTLGVLARVGKKALAAAIRNDLIRPWVRLNWGDDAARRFCPEVALGMTEQQDFSRNANAVAKLAQAGVIPPPLYMKVLGWLGMGSLVKKNVPLQPDPADGTNEQRGGTQRVEKAA
jgi:hypothetical protein